MTALLTESCNDLKTKINLAKHFLKVKYSFTLYSGKSADVLKEKLQSEREVQMASSL